MRTIYTLLAVAFFALLLPGCANQGQTSTPTASTTGTTPAASPTPAPNAAPKLTVGNILNVVDTVAKAYYAGDNSKAAVEVTSGLDAANVIYSAYEGQTIPDSAINTGVSDLDTLLHANNYGQTVKPTTLNAITTGINALQSLTTSSAAPSPSPSPTPAVITSGS